MKKELEALLEEVRLVANRHYISSCDKQITKLNCLQVEDEIYRLVGKIEILLKTPPTADEVCKALSKEFGHTYYYDEDLRDFWCEEFGSDDHMQTWYLSNEPLNELVDYPHLITLIGKFYEGLEGDNNATL